jgi:hypothetical protein
VVEIEKALQTLAVEDARKIADCLRRYLDEKCDQQIDADIAAGRLDELADKAVQDYQGGRTKPLDEIMDESCFLAGLCRPTPSGPRARPATFGAKTHVMDRSVFELSISIIILILISDLRD